jgi:hypothetical protein
MSSKHDHAEQGNPDPPPAQAPATAVAPPPAGQITTGEATKAAKLGAIQGGVQVAIMWIGKHLP